MGLSWPSKESPNRDEAYFFCTVVDDGAVDEVTVVVGGLDDGVVVTGVVAASGGLDVAFVAFGTSADVELLLFVGDFRASAAFSACEAEVEASISLSPTSLKRSCDNN